MQRFGNEHITTILFLIAEGASAGPVIHWATMESQQQSQYEPGVRRKDE